MKPLFNITNNLKMYFAVLSLGVGAFFIIGGINSLEISEIFKKVF